MKTGFPYDIGSHVVALTGVAALHTGIAVWAMTPQPPVTLPQQQIIQITMVAPTVIQQENVTEPVQEPVLESPKVAPTETGMVKIVPKVKPVQKTDKKPDRPESPKDTTQVTQLTTGLQSTLAQEKNAAITEPVAAAYLKNPPPEYPARARSKRQQGIVMLVVRVSQDGLAKTVAVSSSSGHTLLDTAAVDAIKQWKFVPARRGSSQVEASVVVPVEFKIN